jgi:hypothetical protein
MDPKYPVALDEMADPFAVRAQVLDLLQRLARGEVAAAPAVPPVSAPVATNTLPPVRAVAPASDDRPPPPPVQAPKVIRADETW